MKPQHFFKDYSKFFLGLISKNFSDELKTFLKNITKFF